MSNKKNKRIKVAFPHMGTISIAWASALKKIGVEPLIKIMSDELRNVLICRKNDSDLRQSAYENICGCIYDLGLEDKFVWHTNPLEIILKRTGQKIVFRGRNVVFALFLYVYIPILQCFSN